MTDVQTLFDLTWPYLAYVVPTIFILSVMAFADLIVTFLIGIVSRVNRKYRVF